MRVKEHDLMIIRGDSDALTLRCENYSFIQGDTVEFTVRKDFYSKKVLKKEKTEFTKDGAVIFYFYPEDTKHLDFGNYVYDVQLTTGSGIVNTFIKPAKFTILPEVTY